MHEVVIYVGSNEGLFEIKQNGDDYATRQLDVEVMGGLMDGVRAILVDNRDPDRIFIGTTTNGILRSTDGGETWHEASQGIIYRNVWCLSQHPTTGDLYAGTELPGVFRSTDGGDTWVDLPAVRALPETKEWWFPMPPHVAHIRHIGLHPDDPDDIFCAVEDGWLVRSRDGGKTWAQHRGVHIDAHMVTFMPDDPTVVYVSTGDYGFRSTDGGETFVEAREGMDRGYMAGIVVHPDRPSVVIAAASNPPGAWFHGDGARTAIYRSEDAGVTWQRVAEGLPDDERFGTWSVVGDPGDPDRAYVGLFDGRIWGTEDGGKTFREVLEIEAPIMTMACVRRG